jgi:hypothetical protein
MGAQDGVGSALRLDNFFASGGLYRLLPLGVGR